MTGIRLCLASVLLVLAGLTSVRAEQPSPADIAWIEKCISDRAEEQLDPAKLRVYCACMQGIVEDNEPFTVTGLERTYPPAHVMCHQEAGLP